VIEERFERAFKETIERHGADLFAQVDRVEDAVAEGGLIYRNKSFPLLPKITVLSARQRDELATLAERLSDLLEKVLRIFATDADTRGYFMLKDSWYDLASIDPGYGRRIRIARFDTYPADAVERLKVLENNTDCPAGVLFTGRVNQVLAMVPAFAVFLRGLPPVFREPIDAPDGFFDALLAAYEEWSGRRAPVGVAVLQLRNRVSPEAHEMIKLLRLRKIVAVACDPRDLRFVAGKLRCGNVAVDLVWNKINTADFVPLLEASDAPEEYLQACRERAVCQVNAFDARFVTESKLCAAYLTEPRFRDHFSAAERALIDTHIPWTKRLVGNPELEFAGSQTSLRQLARGQREDLVLKVAYDIRGDGVTVGRAVSQADWERALERAWDGPYVLQQFVPPRQVDVPCVGSPPGFLPHNFSVDLFMFGGQFAGFGSKLSRQLKVNVFQGGSKQALVSVALADAAPGRLVRVFSQESDQGNPAIVVQSADELSDVRCQALASQFGGVTVFLSPSTRAAARVRCFSPKAEIAFCGHGILAGAYTHARRRGSRRFSVETRERIVEIEVGADGLVSYRAAQPVEVRRAAISVGDAMAMLALGTADCASRNPLCIASIGSATLLVPVANRQALSGAKPQLELIAGCSERYDFNDVFVYVYDPQAGDDPVYARAFNPRSGVDEDAATGVAAGALAALLAGERRTPASFRIVQGEAIGRPSEIHVRVDEQGVQIGGYVTPAGAVRSSYADD
jgi:PhzF family phenazine biosynthesis protein